MASRRQRWCNGEKAVNARHRRKPAHESDRVDRAHERKTRQAAKREIAAQISEDQND